MTLFAGVERHVVAVLRLCASRALFVERHVAAVLRLRIACLTRALFISVYTGGPYIYRALSGANRALFISIQGSYLGQLGLF